ncbi:hypothetical protein GX51_03391 [Blastomyces parvus]|uniref:Uncharacterized protein n=1 Tax=Blastomyces parvus TaxID=2060905 RepID=A0A2B7X6Q8_9EURO|nr:hypothetical protein GX51_03391 [Blastomyces parvus]
MLQQRIPQPMDARAILLHHCIAGNVQARRMPASSHERMLDDHCYDIVPKIITGTPKYGAKLPSSKILACEPAPDILLDIAAEGDITTSVILASWLGRMDRMHVSTSARLRLRPNGYQGSWKSGRTSSGVDLLKLVVEDGALEVLRGIGEQRRVIIQKVGMEISGLRGLHGEQSIKFIRSPEKTRSPTVTGDSPSCPLSSY